MKSINATERNFPVLVGVGQVLDRVNDVREAKEPLEMMWDAIQHAQADSVVDDCLKYVDSIRVIRGMWPYQNPAKNLASRLDLHDVETVGTLIGGNQNQAVVNETAAEILAGERKFVLITGAENGNSSTKARKQGINLRYTECPGSFDRVIGAAQQPEHHAHERAKGINRAIQVYPMYDNAIRYQRSESIGDHIDRVARLWKRFNDVGLRNPNAWVQVSMTPREIATPSTSNRPISFPYTKFMNANMSVNMGAALLMTSVGFAQSIGVPESKWVYPLAGVKGYDRDSASVREEFYSSPGIRTVGARLLELADTSVEALDFVDLYSCFPSAVQVAATEYGLSHERDLTVTGGLTFGGGPLNNYVMHSIARTVELIREKPGSKGLVTANGGNIYKHVHSMYGHDMPAMPFQSESVQDEVDAFPARTCLASFEGSASIESYTVMYDDFEPSQCLISCRTDGDERVWAVSDDRDLALEMTQKEFCGRSVHLSDHGQEVSILS